MSAGISQDPVFVGPYRLVNRLGEGGMGVVHLALDPAGRAVALKLLRPHVAADPDARRRLAREVDTLRRVRHPHVAPVLDADLAGDIPFVVTPFVPGRTLEAYVQQFGPLSPEHVAHLARVLADALRTIHSAGVVHRDLKPANVMLVDGQPVVIDFGIAHMVDDTRITMTGLVMGTPGYLSPEVVDGQPVTPATDWWGWGATLAYAATGRPPFGTGSATVVLDRVRRGACDLAGVDARLAGVLSAALVVDPRRRPPIDVLLEGLGGLGTWTSGVGQSVAPPSVSAQSVGPPNVSAPGVESRTGAPAQSDSRRAPDPAVHAARTVVQPPAAGAPRVVVQPPPPLARGPAAGPPAHHEARTVVNPAVTVPNAPFPTRPYTSEQQSGNGRRPVQPPVVQPPVVQPPVVQPPVAQPPVVRPPEGDPASLLRSEPGLLTGTTLLALATLAALAGVTPGLAIILSVLWLLTARLTDVTVTGLLRRRYQRGPRPGDIPTAIAALPWRVLVAIPITLATLIVPALMATSIAFFTGAATSPSSPHPASPVPLAAGLVAGWLAAWWGPGGSTVRRGSHIAVRGLVRRRVLNVVVAVVLVFVCAAAVLVARGDSPPDWSPFGRPPGAGQLVKLPTGGGLPSLGG